MSENILEGWNCEICHFSMTDARERIAIKLSFQVDDNNPNILTTDQLEWTDYYSRDY